MKKKIKSLKKTLFSLFIVSQIFVLTYAPVSAANILDYSPPKLTEKIIEKIENMFGSDRDSTKEMVSQMNSAPYKTIAPQVQILFNPPNPKPGEKITATAVASYFNNDGPGLYFTWYLSRLDENGDRELDSEEMKKIAAKIVANGGNFDDAGTSSEWEKDWENFDGEIDNDSDNDGYTAIFGGESPTASKSSEDEEAPKYCYAHDFETGKNHEIECKHYFPDGICGESGKFSDSAEASWGTNPFNPDTDGDGTKDEADLCGLGQNTITWNYKPGDKIGVIVEGTSSLATKYYDSSYMIFWALPKNSCEVEDLTEREENLEDECSIEIDNLADFIETFNAEDECVLGLLAEEIEAFLSAEIPSSKILVSLQNITLLETDAVADINSKIIAGLIADLQSSYPSIDFNDISNDLTHLLEDFEDGYTNEKAPFEIDEGEIEYDDCLVANLISPTEGNAFSKMDISLSYKPKSPLNTEGSTIDINAFVSNSPDLEKTKYTWSFFACSDIDVCDKEPISFSKIKSIGKTVGMGLNNISFPLGPDSFPESRKYLKVNVKASVNFEANAFNSGAGTVYIPITNSADNSIQIFSTEMKDGKIEKLKDENGDPYPERCSEKDPCPVLKQETILLEGPDNLESYSWVIDGKPFSYENCSSTDNSFCNPETGENTKDAYFTITNGEGQIHKVNLIAENPEDGSKVDILRSFKVSEPKVKIKPQDCNGLNPGRNILGLFKEGFEVEDWCLEEGEKTNLDFSQNNFFVTEGEEIRLKADFNFSSTGKKLSNYFWTIDGIALYPDDIESQKGFGATIEGDTISFEDNKYSGESYSVSFTGYYSERSSAGTLSEKLIGDTIEIKVVPASTEAMAKNGQGKILATIFTGFSSYLLFIFKTTLLIALLLFASQAMLYVFPKIKN